MSRQTPRFIPSSSLVEVTARTPGSRFLLTPTPALNQRILRALGRGLSLYPVALHAVAFMSNHWHGLLSVADAHALSRFVQHLHSNIARAVHAVHGWNGRVLGKAAFIVVSPTSEEDRLRYVLAQGVKEGLVRHVVDWPGVHCGRALLLEETLVGSWLDRRSERVIRMRGATPAAGRVHVSYPIDLAPLPSWRDLDAGERYLRIRSLVSEIEDNAHRAHPVVLGAHGVLARDPLSRPEETKQGSARKIHTADDNERVEFAMQRRAFTETLLYARDLMRRQQPTRLPPECFPPVLPFRRTAAVVWSRSEERQPAASGSPSTPLPGLGNRGPIDDRTELFNLPLVSESDPPCSHRRTVDHVPS